MKIILTGLVAIGFALSVANAQEIKENVEPLSSKSKKGFMYDVSKDENGNCNLIYKIKSDKKSDEVSFEQYSFDKNLKFLTTTDVKEKKEQKEDVERISYYANVGGNSSFSVLSMKLKLNKVVALKTWNHEKQIYIIKKIISNETIKPRNDDGKVYYGYASYESEDIAKSNVLVIAKTETKDKNQADKFQILMFNNNLELKEMPIDLNGSYSLVYCQQMPSEDVVVVFAPNKGAKDVTKYVYYQIGIEGNIKNKVEFKSPSSALFITNAYENASNIYFFGTSAKTNDAFAEMYSEYAPIFNPGAGAEDGNNLKDIKWRKHLEDKMDNFHLLKFSASQLAFASTTPVAEFKSKFKTAPGDKGASAYKGKKFYVENFFVTEAEDYLVAGQLTGSVKMGTENRVDTYEDIVCFHFDKTGSLKAQYGIGKMNNDKKSEIFDMTQKFYSSADGKSLYWNLMEIKGVKGYESFLDALAGNSVLYPLFFPRVVKIDLGTASMGAVKVLGDEKYFLRKDFPGIVDPKERSITYIGHDEDGKNIWISKLMIP